MSHSKENKVIIDYYEEIGKTSIELAGDDDFIKRILPTVLSNYTTYPINRTEEKADAKPKLEQKLIPEPEPEPEPLVEDISELETDNNLEYGKTNDEVIKNIISNKIKDIPMTAELDTNHPLHHYNTGILVNNKRERRYKCRYKCRRCGREANRYVLPTTMTIQCHDCDSSMIVKSVGHSQNDYDSFNNFYIAGDMSDNKREG